MDTVVDQALCKATQVTPGCQSTSVDAVHHTQPNSACQLFLLKPNKEPGPAAHAHYARLNAPVLLAPALPFSRAPAWRQLLSA